MIDTRTELHARHLRTLMGMGLMLFAVGFVILDKVLEIKTGSSPCPTSTLEVVHVWIFPVLIFLAGLALFSRHAFGDLVGAGRHFVRRR